MSATARRRLGLALIAAGLLLVVIAGIYFTTPADSLPSLLGTLEGNEVRRTKRGAAALVLGGVALYLGVLSARRGSRAAG